jgi:amino acid transporter
MPRKWVYRIGVTVIFIAVFLSPASYLIFGKIEKGKVIEIVFEYTNVSLLPSSTYPRIEFNYQNKSYIILGEENEAQLVGDEVKVIFFKDHPDEAKVLTFWGLFIESIIELPIGLLIWWALFQSYPTLFEPSQPISFDNLLQRKNPHKRKEIKISDAPLAARFLIYLLVAGVVASLLYAIWIIYKEMASRQLSYQIGIGISVVILLILITIINKVHKG